MTEKHGFASQLSDHDRATEVLHIGDHDPSGAHMFLALKEDVEAFARELGGDVKFTRIAITPKQIVSYRLPTAPPKKSDKRAFTAGRAKQKHWLPMILPRFCAMRSSSGLTAKHTIVCYVPSAGCKTKSNHD